MEISKLQSFWKKKSENDGSKHKTTKSAVNPSWNSNNSSNKDVLGEHQESLGSDEKKNDDLDEIRPEVTPEGYGLRTPYGTHLNLDFLKYCQNIAEGQTYHVPSYTRRLSSSSLRSSLNTSDGKLSENSAGSDKEVSSPDPKVNQNEKNLFETRRRLDAFRSYRRKVPAGMERQQYLGRFPKMSPGSNVEQKEQFLENDTTEPPVLSNLLNVPIQQQNLQVVREQMAAALTRLKFLESEVKQIQVLQVQISVLKQEKQRLSTELKKHKEKTNTDAAVNGNNAGDFISVSTQLSSHSSPLSSPRKNSKSLTTAPPPPPQRRFKSIAVGTDDKVTGKKTKLSKTATSNIYIPPEQHITTKDACVGISPELTSKHSSTEVINLCNVSTSSKDLISTVTVSCGEQIRMLDAECQYEGVEVKNIGTDALPAPVLVEFGTDATPHPVLVDSGSDARPSPVLIESGNNPPPSRVLVDSGSDAPPNPVLVDSGSDARPRPVLVESGNNPPPTQVLVDSGSDAPPNPVLVDSGSDALSVVLVECGTGTTPSPILIESGTDGPLDAKDCYDAVESEKYNGEYTNKSTDNKIVLGSKSSFSDATTNTVNIETKNQGSATYNATLIDNAVMCKFENADFACQRYPDVENAGTIAETVLTKDSSTVVNIETCDFGSQFRPDMQNFATTTETVATKDCTTITDIFKIETENQTTNTTPVNTVEKSVMFQPDSTDFGCDVRIHSGIAVATATESVILEESETNTDTIDMKHATVQSTPDAADFGCVANILPETCNIGVLTIEEKVLSHESCAQTISVQTHDAVTDTSDFGDKAQAENVQSEISTYVGQVETLLEEQQSLLANNFQEFEQVLDENSSTEVQQEKIVIKEQNNSFSNSIGQLDVFAKDGYELSSVLKSACRTIASLLNCQGEDSSADSESSMLKLQQEWFSVAALPKSRPEYIKDFVSGVKEISQDVLRLVVNSLDETGNSALHYAISHENFALIYTLSSIDELDPDQYNKAGYTASMLAAITHIETEFEVQAVASLFQRANVSLHAKQAGQTALMLAVSHGCVPAAKLLLKAGADINSQDEDGSTALMCATEHGHIELVKLLLAQPNCDPTITDNDGSSAINIAMESGQRDIGVLLYVHLKLDKHQD